ncbi:MAG: hypothetical protein WCO60_03015 [Verrucomicrobiota bacterium]
MPVEEITGIHFPSCNAPKDPGVICGVLDAVSACCSRHLLAGGYYTEQEAEDVLSAYQSGLSFCCEPGNVASDFIAFTAETQAKKNGLTAEGEVARMQRLLRWSLSDRVRCWSFGVLPGAVDALYCHCVSTRLPCGYLGCPSMLGGEASIVHVAGVNPVSALVVSAWIRQEMTASGESEAPFVFPLMVDLPSWHSMLQRHFGEL